MNHPVIFRSVAVFDVAQKGFKNVHYIWNTRLKIFIMSLGIFPEIFVNVALLRGAQQAFKNIAPLCETKWDHQFYATSSEQRSQMTSHSDCSTLLSVSVETMHSWCLSYIETHDKRAKVCDKTDNVMAS